MENIKTPWVRRILKILKWTFLILLGLYLVAGISVGVYRFIKSREQIKTDAEVEKIMQGIVS